MKSIINRIIGFLATVIIVVLIAVFILNLRQGQASPSNNTAGQSGYPPPQNAATQPTAYPLPSITSNQSNNSQSPSWLTYHSKTEIGFSFRYRSDFLLSTDQQPSQAFGEVRLIFPRVGASTISILENPERLSLEDFMESEEFLNGVNFVWPNQWLNTYPESFIVAGQPSLAFQSHRDLVGLFGAAGYVIFTPFGEYVIQAVVDGGGPTPGTNVQPYEASDEALELTVQVLNSIRFSTLPTDESVGIWEQNTCNNLGEWATYTNNEAGYSLRYPAESKLLRFSNYISISLKSECYEHICWGSNRIVVSKMNNPDKLPIEEFIMQEFQLGSAPTHKNSMYNFQTSRSQVEIAGTRALRIEDGITLNKPEIFIPHEEKVIWIYVSKVSNMPPHDPPCEKTLDLLDEILTSIELLSS